MATLTRRSFLHATLIGVPMAMALPGGRGRAAGSGPAMLLVSGIAADAEAGALFDYLDPILSQGVPVSCLLRHDPARPDALAENAPLCALLDRLRRDYAGLAEIVLHAPGLTDPRGFFRMRNAARAQNAYRRAMAPLAGQPVTALAAATDGAIDGPADGLRSAGFRTLIRLPSGNSAGTLGTAEDGTRVISGGRRFAIDAEATDLDALLAEALAGDALSILVADWPAASPDRETAFALGARLGDRLALALRGGGTRHATTPSELLLQSGEAPPRHLALCIEAGADSPARTALLAGLDAAGLRHTPLGPEGCALLTGAPDDAALRGLFATLGDSPAPRGACLASPAPLPGTDMAGLDLLLNLSAAPTAPLGLSPEGVLRLSPGLVHDGRPPVMGLADLERDLEEALAPLQDAILVIRADAFASAAEAETFVAALAAIGASGLFTLGDLADLQAAITARDEPARLVRAAARERRIAPPVPDPQTDLLLADARRAWAYFEALADPVSGLAPATAWREGGGVASYDFATMWDTGTQILATIGAHSLGLIEAGDFRGRIARILGHLGETRQAGLILPRGMTSTSGTAAGIDSYNASDTGRLLTALKVLETYVEGEEPGIADIVAGWDLDRTIREGMLHNITDGVFEDATATNYADYMTRGFALWGFEVASPYRTSGIETGFAADVEILHEIARLGPIGAEPHLLGAVELGQSDVARVAADALMAAQIAEHRATGRLLCVSEVPIDREPWFVYQGYQIGAEDPWVIRSGNPAPRFDTPGFRRSVEMVSTKAAFLWHVTRPGPYSDLLIAHVREKARGTVHGFAPGVLTALDAGVPNYADLNTNGVILEAIAMRLNGGRPAIEWRMSAAPNPTAPNPTAPNPTDGAVVPPPARP
ncbi:DUF3131 domain-containing protein [Halovulum dunhuangense]|uniref:DUF3131 domain-containing protein n=1 Tax=Halovulum dunhuangense TaxID=1505036 RepID=A0A849L104_9RHOB|nr:DUF3131 domain-containing protein [Halovulum dunhuangense]NNU79968.1 DUF3131 domain-containing protein [Halovulum dunhuangense]